MDAVIPPPAQGAPQWVIAAKKPLPNPNDTVGPAAANGAGKDPEVQAEVDEARDEAFKEKYAEAECRAVVGILDPISHTDGATPIATRNPDSRPRLVHSKTPSRVA